MFPKKSFHFCRRIKKDSVMLDRTDLSLLLLLGVTDLEQLHTAVRLSVWISQLSPYRKSGSALRGSDSKGHTPTGNAEPD